MPTPPRPGLDILTRIVDDLTPELSDERRRQFRMVLGELDRALAHDDYPLNAGAPLDQLLAPNATAAYLDLAARGELRHYAPHRGRPSPTSTVRIRMHTLTTLAAAADHPIDLGTLPGDFGRARHAEARATVAPRQREILRRYLARQVNKNQNDPYRIRLLAIVGIVLDTAASAGELAAMHIEDFDDFTSRRSSIRVTRTPQGRTLSTGSASYRLDRPQRYTTAQPATQSYRLRVSTHAAVQRWLIERARIVEPVNRDTGQLWVSLFGNHTGEQDGTASRRPPGMPLQAKGIQRAYRRAITSLNGEMHGAPGWLTMPSTLEELRRGVDIELREKEERRRQRSQQASGEAAPAHRAGEQQSANTG